MAVIKIYATEDTTSNNSSPTSSNSFNQPGTSQPSSNGLPTQDGQVSWRNASSIIAGGVVVKSMANYGLQNIETYTGDHLAQVRMNNTLQGAGMVAMALANPWIAAAQVAVQMSMTTLNENQRRKTENAKLEISRARNGYTDTASILNSRRH